MTMTKRNKPIVRYDIVHKKGKPKKLSKSSASNAKKIIAKIFGNNDR